MSFDAALPLIEKADPERGDNPYWRPWTLSRTFMISYTMLCIVLLIANELCMYGCQRYGSCTVFGQSNDGNIPALSIFIYTALPTVLGIALSLRWILPHHDITRLEPYFQMSTKYGGKASTVLFTRYPYDLFFWLPVKALGNKHYIVAISSVILLLTNFVVVPLVPTMFDHAPINTTMLSIGNRVEFDPTAGPVSTYFTFSAYEHAWKDAPLDPFMGEDYALLPVKTLPNLSGPLPSENWTAETTLFEASLDCADARVEYSYDYWRDNNSLVVEMFRPNDTSSPSVRVCDAVPLMKGVDMVDKYYNKTNCSEITAFITPWTSMLWQLGNPEVEEVTYMIGWASGPPSPPTITENFKSPVPVNITAMFCTPRYYTQSVNATISMVTGKILDVTRIDRRKTITALQGFERIIDGNVKQSLDGVAVFQEPSGNRIVSDTKYPRRFGYRTDKIIDLKYDLTESFGPSEIQSKPATFGRVSESNVFMTRTDSLASFALYKYKANSEKLGDLLDREELRSTFEKALKLWFAYAVATESAISNSTSHILVDKTVPNVKITVNKWWSLGARIGLPLIVILSGVLTFLLDKRVCHLNAEPNTIAASLSLLSASPALCDLMKHSEYYKLQDLCAALDKKGFYLRMDSNLGSTRIRVFNGGEEDSLEIPEPPTDLEASEPPTPLKVLEKPEDNNAPVQKDCETVSPDRITTANLVIFPILIAGLVTVYELSNKYHGLPMPGDPNSFWSKIFYGYLPMAAGLLAKALLVILGTAQNMMSPYRDLVAKEGTLTGALGINYNYVPPHFQLLQALKRRQFTLAALSVAILLSNVLSVFLSAIFEHSIHVPTDMKSHDPVYNINRVRQEVFLQLDRNLTSRYSPTWTTGDYYIDSPFKIAPFSGEDTYQTRGFGVDVSCNLVPYDLIQFPCSHTSRYNGSGVCYPQPDGTTVDNVMYIQHPCDDSKKPITVLTWNGSCVDAIVTDAYCESQIFPLWAQNNRYTVTENYSLQTEDDFEFVVLNCTLTNSIVDLRATVRDGIVLSLADVHALSPSSQSSITKALAGDFTDLTSRAVSDYKMTGPHPLARINELMAKANPAVVSGRESHVPSAALAAETFANVLKRLFPLLLRLEAERLFKVEYEAESLKSRAYVKKSYFGMALGALVFCAVVVVKLYTDHTEQIKGHLPWTLAGMYSQLYESNAKDGINMAKKRPQGEDTLTRYAYGKYPEELGNHYGVYQTTAGTSPRTA
ncbi:hypothetical protein DFP73DRAFT_238505 [Morchella snyderi]|nr:hypothetical protein DFP73DRAFT_238505 [Morchella snyderi]